MDTSTISSLTIAIVILYDVIGDLPLGNLKWNQNKNMLISAKRIDVDNGKKPKQIYS